ncbi:MAG: hypothetical protein JO257_11820 [Deltaproteobacteria bacterium]|nr:hypothetical protein [Deltaproteobacteria bacterium]
MKRLAVLVLATGCAADPDPAFHLHGVLRDPSAATTVIATAGQERAFATIDAHGDFDLTIAPGATWAIAFADPHAALVATWRANGLDALPVAAPGSLDLGELTIAGGYAVGATSVDDLGLANVDELGAHDDLALRTATPDADGDGVIDVVPPRIDLVADIVPTIGSRTATLDDLVRGTPIDGVALRGTGIIAGVSAESVTFEQPFWGTVDGPSTNVVPAGTPIGAPALRPGMLDGVATIGVVARPLHDVPSGRYVFGGTTFPRVLPPSDAALRAELFAPDVRLVPTDGQCVTDCSIAAIEVRWPDGVARASQLDLLTPQGYLGIAVPEAVSTSLPWARKPDRMAGMTTADLARITTAQLCYVAVTFSDRYGVRVTSTVANPACP